MAEPPSSHGSARCEGGPFAVHPGGDFEVGSAGSAGCGGSGAAVVGNTCCDKVWSTTRSDPPNTKPTVRLGVHGVRSTSVAWPGKLPFVNGNATPDTFVRGNTTPNV